MMKCDDLGDVNMTTSDANRFWWPIKIPDTVSTFGIYGLLGEIPSVNNYAYPYTLPDTTNKK